MKQDRKVEQVKPLSEIMTLDEVCDYLQTSKFTVYRLISSKSIPATKVGGQWRFKRDQINVWFLNQCITRLEKDVILS